MEVTKMVRHRIKISTTAKGVETPECTVDMTGFTEAEVLAASDSLVAALRKRYQVQLDIK